MVMIKPCKIHLLLLRLALLLEPSATVEDVVDNPLVTENVNTTEQQNFPQGIESVPALDDVSLPILDAPLPAPLAKPSEAVALNPVGETSYFSSFLPEGDACMLGDFASRHEGFLLDKVAEDLKALALFGFKWGWFDKLVDRLNQTVPLAVFEDMEELANAIVQQSQRNDELRTQLARLRAELVQGESELERLSLKRQEIEDARAILNSSLDL
ncbi:hypothetical protein SESBI_27141 [Sesbania bispinosa]|nr:hypothetical protein SESBI_27141 [Sesbania bispinosa]